MIEDKIKPKIGFNINLKENTHLYAAALALSTIVGCNAFNYPQSTKEFTITCSPQQTLYCSEPQGYMQKDCTCYDNLPSNPQNDLWVRLW